MLIKNRRAFDKLLEVLSIKLHEKQREIVDAFFGGQRFMVVVAGRRSGKTLLAALLALYACLGKDTKIWIVSKTYGLAEKVFNYLVPMVEKLLAGKKFKISENTLSIRFPWGASVECKSAEHEASLLGEGVDLLIIDEAAEIKERVWTQRLSPTLRDRKGSVLMITTPLGRNWIYDLFIKGQKREDGFWSLRFPSWVNSFVYDEEEKELAKSQLDSTTFRGQHEAEFVSYANVVYSDFNRDQHVREVPDLTGWTITLSVDPGYNGACAMLWIAHNVTSEEDFVIREVVQPQMKYDQVLDIIQRYEPEDGYEALVCDIAGRATSQESGTSFVRWMEEQEWMRDHRYFWQSMKSNFKQGFDDFQVVRSRILNAQGRIRLFVAPDAYELIYALENYSYPDSESSEVPIKDGRTDHPADALRYYLIWRYRGEVCVDLKRR